MPIITGRLENGTANPITGLVYVNYEAPIVDVSTVPDTWIGTERWSTPITNGTVSFTVQPTKAQNVPVRFAPVRTASVETWYTQGGVIYTGPKFQHSDTQWYTGQAPYVAGTNLLLSKVTSTQEFEIAPPFSVVIPDVPSLEFWQLLPSGFNAQNGGSMFSAAYQIAQTLANSPEFSAVLASFKFRGSWDNATNYVKNDVVRRDNALWVSVSATMQVAKDPAVIANQVPNAGAVWELFLPKGDPGGASAASVGYDFASWQAATTTPASRADVSGVINTIQNTPVFTGVIRGGVLPYPQTTNKTSTYTTIDYVEQAIAGLAQGQPPLVRSTLSTNLTVTGAGQTIDWDTNNGSIVDSAGVFTFPAGGGDTYRLDCRLFMEFLSTLNNIDGSVSMRAIVFKNGAAAGDLFQWTHSETLRKKEFRMSGYWEGVLANGDTLAVRMLLVTAGVTGTITARVVGGVADNEIRIRKIRG